MTGAAGQAPGGDDELGAMLDLLAARAWPARETEVHDGWWLRFNDGLHRRVNSVFPERDSRAPLAERIADAETYYRRHRLPPRFQISPACQPADLDRVLHERGYETESGVDIMIAESARLTGIDGSAASLSLDAALSDDWLDIHMAEAPNSEAKRRKGRMLETITQPHVFALARSNGMPVAAGLGIADDGWFGIFGMFTLAAERRLGHAQRLISEIADWALARGAEQAYLQVERDNPAALGLYARAGFKTVHGYHYRTLWDKPHD